MLEIMKKRPVTAIAICAAVLVLGLYLFLYGPLINKLGRAHSECRALESELFQVRESIAGLKTVSTEKTLVTEEGISAAMDELTKCGRSKGITFTSMAPQQMQKKDALYKILPIQMEIESTYEGLAGFLGALEGLKKSLIRVSGFSITPDRNNAPRLHTTLALDMYLKDKTLK